MHGGQDPQHLKSNLRTDAKFKFSPDHRCGPPSSMQHNQPSQERGQRKIGKLHVCSTTARNWVAIADNSAGNYMLVKTNHSSFNMFSYKFCKFPTMTPTLESSLGFTRFLLEGIRALRTILRGLHKTF